MEFKDEILINAPRQVVYDALNDPVILRRCIPGCEELIRHSATDLEAKVVLKIGPVKARFSGNVVLDQAGAPQSFSLTGEGKGGVAGFAKGGADVVLAEVENGTILSYTAKVEVGGKIAQLGSRLIKGTAAKLSAQFFESFAAEFVQSADG
ncbi:MAG: carbon monoxide dehydrogenase subunit G [Paracoccaceae bacterium]|nr:carbon monoxide dehydrogenase subunit G [Paracoccaceae bacterium]